jgi:hypothetical protein
MSGETQSRHCWRLMLVVSLAHTADLASGVSEPQVCRASRRWWRRSPRWPSTGGSYMKYLRGGGHYFTDEVLDISPVTYVKLAA